MSRCVMSLLFIMISLFSTNVFAEPSPKGTKGQNYDRVVFDNPTDSNVELVARIMSMNRFSDSALSIVVTDNGKTVLGPESEENERWTRSIAISGKGRHEVLLVCEPKNASPIYCALNPQSPDIQTVN